MSISYVQRLIREGKYEEAKYETSKLSTLDNLFFQSRIAELTGNFELSLKLSNNGLEAGKTEMDQLKFTIAKAYALWRLFEFDQGIKLLSEVNHIAEELEFDQEPLVGTYHNILGLIYWKRGDLTPAFNQFEEALVIRKEIGDPSPISYTLNNLGNTYLKYKDFPKAEEYYKEAFAMRSSLGHQPAIAASHNSFGRLYDAIGEHRKAKSEHKKCLQLWEEIDNSQFIGKAHRFLAINSYYLGDIESNNIHWMKSDQIFAKLNNSTDLKTNIDLKKKFYLYTQ